MNNNPDLPLMLKRLLPMQRPPLERLRLNGHTHPVISVRFSPDGGTILSGSSDQTLRLWDAMTGVPMGRPFEGHNGPVTSVCFSPDGRTVVSGSWDGTVRIWSVAEGRELARACVEGSAYAVAFAPDGRRIVAGDERGQWHLWAVNPNEIIRDA